MHSPPWEYLVFKELQTVIKSGVELEKGPGLTFGKRDFKSGSAAQSHRFAQRIFEAAAGIEADIRIPC